ncbi:MAG: glycosyltransferase family 39 protein [Bacilli bacterium]|nr:glycosyltransferase family 39 protein [Bacilli bacterium]
MKKFIKICEIIMFILYLVLLPFLKDKTSTLLAFPALLLIIYISSKIKTKRFAIYLLISALLIRIISIFYFKVYIVDDFKTMYDESIKLINGNISFINNPYFISFPYQIGHVIYQALFLKIFNSIVFLKIINSIITSLIVLFIYLISKKLTSDKYARIVSILYLFMFYPLYLNSVLTNQHLPALLSLVGVYLLIKDKDITTKKMIYIGLIFGIANIFRTESIVFIIGIIGYNLFIIDDSFKKKSFLSLTLIVTYFTFNILISNIVYMTPLKTKLGNKYPEWKVYCGLSVKHNGIYNEEDQNTFFESNNKKEVLIERIKNDKAKIPLLMLKKEVILNTQTNYDLRLKNNINNNILHFNQGYLNLIIILFVISLLPRKKDTNKKIILIKIILALYYFVYLFIEISPRYAYIIHILMFTILGIGIENINNLLKKH